MVLTFEQIKELIEMVAARRLSGLELERSGFRLKVEGEQRVVNPPVVTAPAQNPVAAPAADAAPGAQPAPADDGDGDGDGGEEEAAAKTAAAENLHTLNSPIVGTFYRAPNPDADPFVQVGDPVEKGQVLCIVEAMKLMNEIESDVDGVVREIHPKNAQPVEYGEPLFAIEPD